MAIFKFEDLVIPQEADRRLERAYIDPMELFIASFTKKGRSTIAQQIPGSIFFDLTGELGHIPGVLSIRIKSPMEFDAWLAKFAMEKPYYRLVVDDTTKMDEWAHHKGTMMYMASTQGKTFNRSGTETFGPGHPRYQTVVEGIGRNGWGWHRKAMLAWLKAIKQAAPQVILLGHLKDKFVEKTLTGTLVNEKEIQLAGVVKSLYAQRCSDLATLTREGDNGYLNFDPSENSQISGGKSPHCQGKILISKKLPDGTIETYWDRIFTQEIPPREEW